MTAVTVAERRGVGPIRGDRPGRRGVLSVSRARIRAITDPEDRQLATDLYVAFCWQVANKARSVTVRKRLSFRRDPNQDRQPELTAALQQLHEPPADEPTGNEPTYTLACLSPPGIIVATVVAAPNAPSVRSSPAA